ncbi:hypothetical protein DTO280E4_8084 [Paecilomyces variotii]|nr:hypothetical protein DTO169C6_1727 [Paecilomyces variotii]KAJ9266964.1 hypothetical protein DTO195F2_899 [Paecilomyces variotii]KAJ9307018.1 hypothetical protein DTO217A2_3438 [Paecilomyces variotii]KAJ9351859.1 hypothetical protein DTO280E4_8084 [Paecilomyces variotii]
MFRIFPPGGHSFIQVCWTGTCSKTTQRKGSGRSRRNQGAETVSTAPNPILTPMFGSMARSAAVLKRLSRRLGIRTEFGKIISALQSRPFSSLITGAQRLFDSKGFQMSLLVDKMEDRRKSSPLIPRRRRLPVMQLINIPTIG